jgi:hypothetical protein
MSVSGKIVLPNSLPERTESISIYDMHGRLLGRCGGKKMVFDIKKELGISPSVVFIKTENRCSPR